MESRFDAKRLFKDVKWKPLGKAQWFVINFFIALSTALFLYEDGMTQAMQNTIFVLIFAIGLWLTEAIPPYVVGAMTTISLVCLLGSDVSIDTPIDITFYTHTSG